MAAQWIQTSTEMGLGARRSSALRGFLPFFVASCEILFIAEPSPIRESSQKRNEIGLLACG